MNKQPYLQPHKATYKLLYMTTLAQRMKIARSHAKLTQKQLAEKAGVEQPAISQLETGKSLKSAHIATIAKACGVSAIWLDKGIGGMTDDSSGFESNVEPASGPFRYYEYPEISWVQAGMPVEAVEISNLASCEIHPSDAWAGPNGFWLKVKGPSMTSPNGMSFPEGMVILVAPGFDVESSQFVVAKMTDTNEATFKQFIWDSGRAFLKPLNPSFPTVEMDGEWVLVGRVVDAKWPRSAL